MFKWFTTRNKGRTSGDKPPAPLQVKSTICGDALSEAKEQLFYEWAIDNHGDNEGKKLYGAYLEVQRCSRLLAVHGDFVAARDAIVRIAAAFPDALAMPVADYTQPSITDGYRRWLTRWCEAYPAPTVTK